MIFITSNQPILLFDSGIGGLSITKNVIEHLSEEDIIYFADTANIPYGPKPQEKTKEIVLNIIEFFIKRDNPKLVTIACNTATAAALESAQKKFDLDILGTAVEATAVEALEKSKNNKVGIIATEATINSSIYQDALIKQNKQTEIFAKAVPEFVELVENNIFDQKKIDKVVKKKLSNFKKENVDSLILGCTHFPFLKKHINKYLGEDIILVDNSLSACREIKNILDVKNLSSPKKKGNIKFYTSSKANINKEFLDFGADYLGLEKLDFKEIKL